MHLLLALTALAAPTVQIETDPSTFAFGGGALHVRAPLPAAPAWTLGLGTYAMDLPGPMVAMAPANRDEGWEARLWGAGAFADWHWREPGRGPSVGVQVAAHRWTLRREQSPDQARMTALLVMPRVGYEWFPFQNLGLYVNPWLGLGGTVRVAGETAVDGEDYALFPVMAFGAVHLGWRF